jgi:hypothetical protein
VRVDDVARYVETAGIRLATVTDFCSLDACDELRRREPHCTIVCGLEVRTAEGDFLLYSADEEYLRSLPTRLASVRQLVRGPQTAVVWAHPFVSQRAKSYDAPSLPEVGAAAPFIDGLELFNGTMLNLNRQQLLRDAYFENLQRIAADCGLAMTAGSDAHEPSLIGHAVTVFPPEVVDAASFVKAIKDRRVSPHYDADFFGVRIPQG